MPFLPPPPSQLFLMRHAQAGWALPGQTDFDRALDATGREEAGLIAGRAAEAGFRPDLILCSTARRCRETADLFLAAFEDRPDIVYSDDIYNAPPASYFDLLSQHAGAHRSVMLLGHNPSMEEILETLAGSRAAGEAVPDGYPTAGFAVLTHAGGLTDDGWLLGTFLRR